MKVSEWNKLILDDEYTRYPMNYWTFEKCKEEALKYTNRKEFRILSPRCYHESVKNSWLKSINTHFEDVSTKEQCIEIAKKYNKKCDFMKYDKARYEQARGGGFLDEACAHMETRFLWTKKLCKEEARKFKSRKKFKKGSMTAYNAACKNNWLDDICEHMDKQIQRPSNFWNEDRLRKECLKYNSRSEFIKSEPWAYRLAKKLGFIDKFFSLKQKEKFNTPPKKEITKIDCEQEAKKYDRISYFQSKSSKIYNIALKKGWLGDICLHMPPKIKRNKIGYWDKETVSKEAKKYKTRSSLKRGCQAAFNAARRNNWLDEFFPKRG